MFKSLFKKGNQDIELIAPFNGMAVLLEEVPDEVFSGKMMGDGIAIIPQTDKLVSPIDGEVVNVFQTKHAITLRSKEGAEILIHMGLETVNLNGEGFQINVTDGEKISKGKPLATFDIKKMEELGFKIITPIVLLNGDQFEIIDRMDNGVVASHGDSLMKIKKKA